MDLSEFYDECGKLLGVGHQGQPFPYYKRTRWNNRAPGQGRYPGRGIIRVYGDVVHIALQNPSLYKICSQQECLDILRALDLA